MYGKRNVTRTWPLTARIGATGIAAFYLASIVAGLFKPGYSHVREAVSALAATDSPGAPVLITGFVLAAVGITAVDVGLRRRLGAHRSGRIGSWLVLVAGLLMVPAGLARQDCSERLPSCIDHGAAPLASGHFWVHQYVSLLLFLLLAIAQFVLARGLRRTPGLAHLARWSRLAGVVSVLGIAGLMVDPPALDPYAGLFQRLFILVLFGWPLVAAAAPARTPDVGEPARQRQVERTATRAASGMFAERRALTPAWVEPTDPG